MSFHKPKFSQLSSVIHWVTHFIYSNEDLVFTLTSSYGEMGAFSKFLALVWSSDVKPPLPPLSSKWHVRLYSKRLCRNWCKNSHFEVLKFDFCALMMSKIQKIWALRAQFFDAPYAPKILTLTARPKFCIL